MFFVFNRLDRRPALSVPAFFVFLCALLTSGAEARDIYVRLSQKGSYAIASDSGMTLTDANGRNVSLGRSATITVRGSQATVGSGVFVMPVRVTSAGLLHFNSRRYRGAFLITERGGLLNVLDIEQYLCGVLPAEVGASWPMEALRAQAIISRTYALKQSFGRAEKGYDVVDTVADQVYHGAGIETQKTNQAVASTKQEIVAYGNTLAFTPFHSDSGGHTADNADVWGEKLPYLVGVPEPVPYTSPVSSWVARIPRSKIDAAVAKAAGGSIGPVSTVYVSEVDKGGRTTKLTFIGTRGTKTLTANQFRLALGASLLKSTMLTPTASSSSSSAARQSSVSRENNLNNSSSSIPAYASSSSSSFYSSSSPSSLPQSSPSYPPDTMNLTQEKQLAQMTADGVFTATELIDMLTNPDKQKEYFQIGLQRWNKTPRRSSSVPSSSSPSSASPSRQTASQRSNSSPGSSSSRSSRNDMTGVSNGGFAIRREGDTFIFYGKGWGHGVGLSQWGCQALAQNGWTAEKILTHYYPGTAVRRYR